MSDADQPVDGAAMDRYAGLVAELTEAGRQPVSAPTPWLRETTETVVLLIEESEAVAGWLSLMPSGELRG